jgi:hypothetical protein
MDTRKPAFSVSGLDVESKVNQLSEKLAKLLEVVQISENGDVVITSQKKLQLKSNLDISMKSSSGIEISASSIVQLKGAIINLN